MDGESQNERDARIEQLWRSLHAKHDVEELDLQGLRDGLRRIDHPLQNADKMLEAIMRTVDTSGDGRIQYIEFRAFIEQTEEELWQMFKSIDHDKSGALDRQELRRAFDQADIRISDVKLQNFFDRVDRNHDGVITFDEWRDFLLFIPTLTPSLRSILSFYSSTVQVTAEGDASVSDENFEGLGSSPPLDTHVDTHVDVSASVAVPIAGLTRTDVPACTPAAFFSPPSLLLLDAVYLVFQFRETSYNYPASLLVQSKYRPRSLHQPALGTGYAKATVSDRYNFPWDPGERSEIGSAGLTHTSCEGDIEPVEIADLGNGGSSAAFEDAEADEEHEEGDEYWLTSLLPHPGYFIAGGLAGAVSRTATAPLDRLKVFLIAQTGTKADTVNAVKSGAPLQALRAAIRPLGDACVELWRVGGIRSLWAGNGLNVVKVAPESAIKFGSYEGAKRIMARFEGHGDPRQLSGVSQFFAAGTGGMISQFAVYPLDTLKFRVQCETVEGGSKGNALIISTCRKMYAEGFSTFYRGLGMGLVGMFPYAALDLTIYEHLKAWFILRKMRRTGCKEEDASPGQMVTGGIGAVSSSLGASAVYPLNLLRTRMQSQGTAIHPPTYDGWRDCWRKTVQQEGLRGLYKGLTPNLLKVVPAMSISYIMYESSKQLIGLR